MSDSALLLRVSRKGRKLRVAFHEKSDGKEHTLLPYVESEISWQEIDAQSREVTALLARANRRSETTPQIFASLKRSGQVLFDLLIPSSAKASLNFTQARYLILYLDDGLVHIPWELLFNGQDFLCRRFAMGRIVSTRQLSSSLPQRRLKLPLNVLILADASGDLEAAYREGVEIRNFLDNTRHVFQVDFKSYPLDSKFVRKMLRDYDIVHYAGHAKYSSGRPLESGWILSDGVFSATVIHKMAGLQSMPALVFSNACQSGQSDPGEYEDEILGIANPYLLAGVQHYIGTFQEVLDEPSFDFAKSFYGFVAQGDTVGEAVCKARHEAARISGEETIAWASYMLYGDPTFAFPSSAAIETVMSAGVELQSSRVPTRGGEPNALTWWARTKNLLGSPIGVVILVLCLTFGGVVFYRNFYSKEKLAARIPAEVSGSTPDVQRSANVVVPLSLTMNVIGQRKEPDGSYTEVLVSEGSVLRSSDNFQIHLETSHPAHVYVLIYDSEGKASQLFPSPKVDQSGFVESGRKMVIPEKDLWFWLDENTGIETLYVLASEKPLRNIRELLRKMEAADDSRKKRISQEIKNNIAIVQRGVGGITKGKTVTYPLSDGKRIEKVTEVVSGTGSVVRAISFQHR